MKIEWRELELPEFGMPEEMPQIPRELYEDRCHRAYSAAGADWLVVYGDREHFANLAYLTGYDPRFEEALLLLGSGERRILMVGPEGLGYATLIKLDLDVVLCASFGLLGQDRSAAPRLTDILRDAGLGSGQSVSVVGWKYLEPEESVGELPGFFAPAMLIDSLRTLVGDPAAVTDATPVLMHPYHGLRARNEIEQIVAFEWAATRATLAVSRVLRGARPGMTEMQAVTNMQFAGEPLSCHVMFASGREAIVGLRSPTSRRIEQGDGATTAIGYWGGLGCRAGLVAEEHSDFLAKAAIPYFRGIATWYQTVGIGVTGGAIFEHVSGVLAQESLRPMLNPGHLTSLDEWLHSPIQPNSSKTIESGMAFQCDIIPLPMTAGWAVNCEDPVVFADRELRTELEQRYPSVWSRIQARQAFMRDKLGLSIRDELLPLSATPAYFSPLWLSPSRALILS